MKNICSFASESSFIPFRFIAGRFTDKDAGVHPQCEHQAFTNHWTFFFLPFTRAKHTDILSSTKKGGTLCSLFFLFTTGYSN